MPSKSSTPISRDLRSCFSKRNLTLALERVQRAQEPQYKWYWRDSASIVTLIEAKFIDRLHASIRENVFTPDLACFFSEPKASGLLRHRALLSFGDLVVMQAFSNIIADKIFPKIRKRYGKTVFGNRYQGPGQKFFLENWRKCYREFTVANRVAFRTKKWLVEFDFASFYDSIDYQVLRTILESEYKINSEFCERLTELLEHWSATSMPTKRLPRIFLGHGIPQGPLGSPIIAEVILGYIDSEMEKLVGVQYLRYADDIRIWGHDEPAVRKAAAILDRLSRNLGIFPQPGKFSIKEVSDVRSVLKEISLPGIVDDLLEEDIEDLSEELKGNLPTQVLLKCLSEYEQYGYFPNLTLFKYILGATPPRSEIGLRLCAVMVGSPELTEVCCRYIGKIKVPSDELIYQLLIASERFPGYPWISGRILLVIYQFRGNIKPHIKRKLKPMMKILFARKGIETDCVLLGVSATFGAYLGSLNAGEIERWVHDSSTPWWSVKFFILNVEEDSIGSASFVGILQSLLQHSIQEVCRAASYRLCELVEPMPQKIVGGDGEVLAIFAKYDLHSTQMAVRSRLNHHFENLIEVIAARKSVPVRVDWQILLGDRCKLFESKIIKARSEIRMNPESCLLRIHSGCETLLDCIIEKRGYVFTEKNGKISKPSLGKFVTRHPGFKTDFPETQEFLIQLNKLRNRSEISHPVNDFSKTNNKRVTREEVLGVLGKIEKAMIELSIQFPES